MCIEEQSVQWCTIIFRECLYTNSRFILMDIVQQLLILCVFIALQWLREAQKDHHEYEFLNYSPCWSWLYEPTHNFLSWQHLCNIKNVKHQAWVQVWDITRNTWQHSMLDMIEKWYWKDSGCTLSYSGFWGYKRCKKKWFLNSGQRFKKSGLKLREENGFANVLVIYVSIHIARYLES